LAANRHGFGNARAVRSTFENAMQNAFNRDNWNGDMYLELTDVAGENPKSNEKLKKLLIELDAMVGWSSIKKSVRDLVSLAEKNYLRQLEGLSPVPLPLNRLFLGSPGTGKTTVSKLK
jgi:AAA+ superfamily predicted ATPase